MDIGFIEQIATGWADKIPAINGATGNYILMAALGLVGSRLFRSFALRAPRAAYQARPYPVSSSRGSLAPERGLFGGFFTLGAWVSAACALVLLLSPHSYAHLPAAGKGLEPVLLFFAVCAMLYSMFQCGRYAMKIGLWVGVCLVLFLGQGAPNLSAMVPQNLMSLTRATAPQASSSLVQYSVHGDMQEFSVAAPAGPRSGFAQL